MQLSTYANAIAIILDIPREEARKAVADIARRRATSTNPVVQEFERIWGTIPGSELKIIRRDRLLFALSSVLMDHL